MAELGKVRELLATMRLIATSLTDEEISDIAKVVLRALKRIEAEQEAE